MQSLNHREVQEAPVLKLKTLPQSWETPWLSHVPVLNLNYSGGDSCLCVSSYEFHLHLGLLSFLVFICFLFFWLQGFFSPHTVHHLKKILLNPKGWDTKWKYVTFDNWLAALILSKQDFHMETGKKWTRCKLLPIPPTENHEPFSGSLHTPWGSRLCGLKGLDLPYFRGEAQGEQCCWSWYSTCGGLMALVTRCLWHQIIAHTLKAGSSLNGLCEKTNRID